jgi:hypothetical protein
MLVAEIVFCLLIVVVALLAGWLIFLRRQRRPKEAGFRYIYVNRDGSARELTEDEKQYLNTRFDGADGNRPYIKFRYESLTPDGHISGYLLRRQLPTMVEVASAPEVNPKDFW